MVKWKLLLLFTLCLFWPGQVVRADGPLSARTPRAVPFPSLQFTTLLGGSGDPNLSVPQGETVYAMALGTDGSLYLTGETDSPGDFPVTIGGAESYGGLVDAFVAKLDPTNGSVDYALFLGGSQFDRGEGIAVDGSGNVYVTGRTLSSDFPVTGGVFQPQNAGQTDGFLVKIGPAGSIQFSTYLGGSSSDFGNGIGLDAGGRIYVSGETWSANFPVTNNALDGQANGVDGFVARFSADGSTLDYATYFGGSADDAFRALTLDSTGRLFLAGLTFSQNFPTTEGALDRTYSATDGFLVVLSPLGAGLDLTYATFLGGNGYDEVTAVAVDAGDNAYLTGYTESPRDFPVSSGALDETPNGGGDAFVVKVAPAGNDQADLIYGTLLGGSATDSGTGIAVDGAGQVYLAGQTISPDLPATPGSFDSTFGGDEDAFFAWLDDSGSKALISYLGGDLADVAQAILLNGSAGFIVGGGTGSRIFPGVSGVLPASADNVSDAFVVGFAPIRPTTELVDLFVQAPSPEWATFQGLAALKIEYGNLGEMPANGGQLSAELGANLSLDSVTPAPDSYSQPDNTLTWTLPSLSYLAGGTIQLQVQLVNPQAEGDNIVELTIKSDGGEAAPDPSSNIVAVTIVPGQFLFLPLIQK